MLNNKTFFLIIIIIIIIINHVLYYFKIQDKTEVRLLLHSLVDVYGSCFSFFLHKKKEKEKEKRTRVTFATLLFLLDFITIQ
jgi:hypothetical protein